MAAVVVRVCVGVCGWMDSLVASMGGSAWTLGAECGERNLGASLGAGDVTHAAGDRTRGTRACTDLCPLLRAYDGRFLSGGSCQLRSIDIPTALDPSPVISSSPPSQSRFQSRNPPWPVAGPIATFTCPQTVIVGNAAEFLSADALILSDPLWNMRHPTDPVLVRLFSHNFGTRAYKHAGSEN